MTANRTKILSAVVTVALLAAGWWLLAPTQIGGRTSYAIIIGNSMEPMLERGDLAIARVRPSYAPGDVVLFRDAPTGKRFLHRIVSVHGNRLVTKGDHNPFVDPNRPPLDAVEGELAITLPGVGSAVQWLVQPVNLAILFFVLVFVALAGGREATRRRPYRVRPVQVVPTPGTRGVDPVPVVRPLFAGALVAVALFGALALLAWRSPETRERTVSGAYAQTGKLTYGGHAKRGAVYPTGRVRAGETAFTRLVPALDVSFDYAFETRQRADVRGSIALAAVVSDGQGWERTLPLAAPAPFTGPTAHVEGRLGVRRLERLVAEMREQTGAAVATFTVALTPRVAVSGYVGTTVVDGTFQPRLPLVYDGTALRFDTSDGDLDTVQAPRLEGSTTARAPGAVRLGPVQLAVSEAKRIGLLGLLVALALLGVSALVLARSLAGTERERIAARFGGRIVRARAVVPEGRWVTEVDSIDALVRIADHYDRVVLHSVEPTGDVYVVDDGVTVYRFRPSGERATAPQTTPLPSR
jgi:signal peptidase